MIISQLGAYINQQISFKTHLISSESSLPFKKTYILILQCLKNQNLCDYTIENNRIFVKVKNELVKIHFYKPSQFILNKVNSVRIYKQLHTPFTKIMCSNSTKGFFFYNNGDVGLVHACVYLK